MAKLVIRLNGVNVREFPLRAGRITVGRNSSNDIVLNEPVVSSVHAAIQLKPEPTLTDLHSTNGTRLNGMAVTEAELRHNDVIRIGSHELTYVDEGVQDFAATMVLQAAQAEVEPAETGPAKAALAILNGPRAGEVMHIEKERTTLGKPGVQVAVILKQADGYDLLPIALPNVELTVQVNGKRLAAEPYRLKDGDAIAIADAQLTFIEQV